MLAWEQTSSIIVWNISWPRVWFVKHKLAISFLSVLLEEKNAFCRLFALDMLQSGHIMLHRSLCIETFRTSQPGWMLQMRQTGDDWLRPQSFALICSQPSNSLGWVTITTQTSVVKYKVPTHLWSILCPIRPHYGSNLTLSEKSNLKYQKEAIGNPMSRSPYRTSIDIMCLKLKKKKMSREMSYLSLEILLPIGYTQEWTLT